MIKILKWELKKDYYSMRWVLGLCAIVLTLLYLFSLHARISGIVSSVYSGAIFAMNVAISLVGGYFIFIFPIWNVVGGFQKPLYLLEKSRGISYGKILLIKIIVNFISVGTGISLPVIGTNLINRFGFIGTEFMIFTLGEEFRTIAATLFYIAVFFPILGAFIFLMLSSIGGLRKTKGIGICVVALILIVSLREDSWFTRDAWLLHIAALLVVTGATIYLAEYKYE